VVFLRPGPGSTWEKVFDGGAVPTNVTLLEPPVAGPKGSVYLRYGRANGTSGTGDGSSGPARTSMTRLPPSW
jgi:hypothetical protein